VKIHHSRPAAEFTVIPNDLLRDERLSIAARGHLAYLLSMPDGWDTNADAEAARARRFRSGHVGEGRRAIRGIYAELKKAGYMHQVKVPDPVTGRWKTETHVYDRPRTDVPVTDRPVGGTSVPPAETPESVDNADGYPPEYELRVFPGGTDVPVTDVPPTGAPVTGTSLERLFTEDPVGGYGEVGDPIADREQPITNPQAGSRWPGDDGPDAQQIPRRDSESPASPPIRAREANGHDAKSHQARELDRLTEWMREHPGAVTR
jgi:hypothetical protein